MIARMVQRRWVSPVVPDEVGTCDGLAYSLWLPARRAATGGVVILHGAGSCKESHHDYARVLVGAGLAALAFDARGHGSSAGRLDGRAIDDVARLADRLRERCEGDIPLALRGSSMGGYLALVGAAGARADAVVAICPPDGAQLRSGLAAGRFDFAADAPELDALLAAHDLRTAVGELELPVLLLHAEGDEQVPIELSRELAGTLRDPRSRLIEIPGGHHRSIQHDEELQAVSVRFLQRALISRER
jgi:alpha-beta hydrolase superfamily lysophospholipase